MLYSFMSSQFPPVVTFFTGIIIGALLSSIYYNVFVGVNHRRQRMSQLTSEKPFFLGVTVTFTSIETKEIFLKEFGEYAKYVKNYEPTTLSYEV